MLSISDLKNGTEFIYLDEPYVVLDTQHKQIGWGGGLTVRMKNIRNGKVLTENFRANDRFAEAELERTPLKYLYNHKDVYWFSKPANPSERLQFTKEVIGEKAGYLKPNMTVDTLEFKGEVLNIKIPIKMDFVVKEAPPGIKGNTAQGGTKPVVLETGAIINAPLFVEEGDIITVNTELDEYVSRVHKAK